MASIEATAIAVAMTFLFVVVLLLPPSHGFNPAIRRRRAHPHRPLLLPAGPLRATEEFQRSLLEAQFANSSPDVAPRIDDVVAPAAVVAEREGGRSAAIAIQNSLLRIAASTDRGQNANAYQRRMTNELVVELESMHEHAGEEDGDGDGDDARIPSRLTGTWELLYSNAQLFRSSPFFLAGRSTCRTPDDARRYDWFCDMHRMALSISNVGIVRQVISRDGRLVNEFEVRVGSVPFLSDLFPAWKYSGGLPFTIDGAIVSTADISPVDGGSSWELYMDAVEIKGSNVPVLRNLLDLDSVALRSRELSRMLEENVDSYEVPRPVLRTTYVDDDMRITRDVDDNVYVYGRASHSEVPTDYSSVLPDLGVASLLEGFNDAITKIYL
jgi:hypothetical protein